LESVSALARQCQDLFAREGRLSRAIPGFIARKPQSDLAQVIAEAITQQSILVAEAGTGTGKTFAYLLPGLISGKKILVSTATKTLQDQLVNKDLPLLVNALGLSLRVQNLKGRANYICPYRVELHATEGHFQTPGCVQDIIHIREKMSQLQQGDRAELPEIAEDSPVWPYVTSTVDNCLNAQCPQQSQCFLLKARKKALEANVVVINHHLFFADSRLKESGFGELLPGMDVLIFDEAHQLAEIAANFYEERLSTKQLRDIVDDMIREWPVIDLANQPLKALSLELDKIIDQLLLALSREEDKLAFETLQSHQPFQTAFRLFVDMQKQLLTVLDAKIVVAIPGLQACRERLLAMNAIMGLFIVQQTDKIRWLERFKHSLVLHATPFEVAHSFKSLIEKRACSWIFTSATLTMAGSFDCFTRRLGLDNPVTHLLESPFNYQEQGLLYMPRSLPDPKANDYYPALLKKVLPIIEACGGRCFFLFTSHKALKQVAQLLSNHIKYPLLVQGEESRPVLLNRFRQLGNAVLLGSATFWEGVDVKGDALSCVIIDKLPFANPHDPVVRGKMIWLKNRNISAFDEYSLPDAVIALKQGAGRLIRDVTDKGVLVIADPRVSARDYGQIILSSLPPLPKTRDEKVVLEFIQALALETA